jgi:hypothetical protein
MKTILVTLLLACSGISFGQTKLIFHKSHSGSRNAFVKTINGNYSNFGNIPMQQITIAALDSVIYLTDTSAIMVTKACTQMVRYRQTELKPGEENLWRPGRDTVYNHPLFSKKHALDSIRNAVKSEYYFKNDIDSTRFVGYDNGVSVKKQKVVKQPAKQNNNEVYLMLVFVIALLLFSMIPATRSSQAFR